MGDVINLNKFRKAREKAAAGANAPANRAKHGRTKANRVIEKVLANKTEATLNAHKRTKPADKKDKD